MISAASRLLPLSGNNYRMQILSCVKLLNSSFATVMNKIILIAILFTFCGVKFTTAQIADSLHNKTFRIAVFSPLFIDSAFSQGLIKEKLPEALVPGLDFIRGVQIALDSLTVEGRQLEVHIYDSKAQDRSPEWLIKVGRLDHMDLIIGAVKDDIYRQLAMFSERKRIPFISVTYPNAGGITHNPYLVIVNPTLESHIESIYSLLVQKHSMDNIYLVRRKNDTRITKMLHALNLQQNTPLLDFHLIELNNSISAEDLTMLVDTSKPVVIVGAGLSQSFAVNLATACFSVAQSNELYLIGMPNWDGFRDLYDEKKFKNFAIRYTTPHMDIKENPFTPYLKNAYFDKYRANPSEMVYKGFESTWYFSKILLNYGRDVISHLNTPMFAPFHNFLFRSEGIPNSSDTAFIENKHLFVVQLFNGEWVRDW